MTTFPGYFEIGPHHIGLAFILDLLIGDPRWMPHPVKLIGLFVKGIELIFRKIFKGPFLEALGGIFLVLIVVSVTFIVSSFVSFWLLSLIKDGSILAFIFFVFLASTTIATKGLLTSVMSVAKVVEEDLTRARKLLSHIVGRDTESLSKEDVLKADIETLSENLSDGVIAPLFYLAIVGLPLAMTYKAINTLDSMVGYRHEPYRYFGWAAARLDDIANFIPARLTAVLILISVFLFVTERHLNKFFKRCVFTRPKPLLRLFLLFTVFIYDLLDVGICDGIKLGLLYVKRAYLITCLYRRAHLSPNSGYPEAAMAGAIGVRLGGPATYRGVPVEKPYIGVSFRPIDTEAVEDALKISTISALIGFFGAILGRIL